MGVISFQSSVFSLCLKNRQLKTKNGRLSRPEAEIHLRRFPLRDVLDLEQFHRLELEGLSDEAVGKDLLRDGEARRDVVVELARETDLVLGRGKLFHERLHALVRLQVRVVLREGAEAGERLRQRVLLLGSVGDAAPRGGGVAPRGDGCVARRDDLLQRVMLELHLALDGGDQVWDQVVPALQLDVDLFPAVDHLVLQADEVVVAPDRPEHRGELNRDQKEEASSDGGHIASAPHFLLTKTWAKSSSVAS